MPDEPRLGIIVPVYNEAENIGNTLLAIAQKVRTSHRVYIVYDFDEDNTLPVARSFDGKGTVIRFVKNEARGVVNAIKLGLRAAEEEFRLVTMADMSDDYATVDAMCGLMDEGFDVVCGSRYMTGGGQVGGPLIKKTISRLAGVSLKFLGGLPTHDVTNSFKLYRRNVIEALQIESDGGFEIGMEIVVKAHFRGFRVTEVPTVWTDREKGESRFKIVKWAPKYLRWYLYAMKKNLTGYPRKEDLKR